MNDVYAGVKSGRRSHIQGGLTGLRPRVPTGVPATRLTGFSRPFDGGTSQ